MFTPSFSNCERRTKLQTFFEETFRSAAFAFDFSVAGAIGEVHLPFKEVNTRNKHRQVCRQTLNLLRESACQ